MLSTVVVATLAVMWAILQGTVLPMFWVGLDAEVPSDAVALVALLSVAVVSVEHALLPATSAEVR